MKLDQLVPLFLSYFGVGESKFDRKKVSTCGWNEQLSFGEVHATCPTTLNGSLGLATTNLNVFRGMDCAGTPICKLYSTSVFDSMV